MTAPIRAILFDLGQVLLAYDEHLVFQAIEALGPAVSPYEVFGDDPKAWKLQDLAESGELTPADKVTRLNRLFGLALPEAAWAAAWAAGCTGPVPGVLALAERLASTTTIGVLSNTVPWHWAAALELIPQLRRWENCFLSYELGCRKPGPRIYEMSAAGLGLPTEQLLFIDDRVENVDGARAVGMQAVTFEGPEALARALETLGLGLGGRA